MRPEFNVPNRITMARLFGAIGLFVVLALYTESGRNREVLGWWAFILFVVTAATDWLDGYLARKLGEVTVFGRIMDPFVDKVVVCGAFVFLLDIKLTAAYLPAWIVVIVVGREFFVSSIRGYVESRGIAFAAEWSGKIKMVIQCVAVGALVFMLPTTPTGGSPPAWVEATATVFVWATLLSTVQSGGVYLLRAVRALSRAET